MKIALIGAGKMATALATAIVNGNLLPIENITAVDPIEAARQAFTQKTGIRCLEEGTSVVPQADLLILAVKPQVAPSAVTALPAMKADGFVISICAGIPIAKLATWFKHSRIVRVMPNTPLMVGKGASAYATSSEVTQEQAALAQRILGQAGIALQVKEEQLDAVTALSGSGPAYVFELAKAMALAGEKVGLSPEMSLDLTIQTIAGAAEMMVRHLGTPDSLRDAVTSPNGTTYAGLMVMSKENFRDTIERTVIAARDRSIELGKN